ncbi:hypothetical protein HYC85_023488 [Camellia sinensis]|uniref:Inhibitor I9 domain-containing protein n=1 Tax=Camellia sinensis TaxID=4442 RepID=A0A7J7GER3_CAMSI|nr:hypothetical protein HYC85_023488 [Camellia sinensis]
MLYVPLKQKLLYLLQVTPKFCKQYGQVGDVINKALSEYKEEVTNGSFPGPAHSPYKINAADVDGFLNELQKLGLDKAASTSATVAEKIENAESPDVYVVYMGSRDGHDPDEILMQNHQFLTDFHGGSVEQARASHVYSYRHGFRGFTAKLTEDQAFEIANAWSGVGVSKQPQEASHDSFMGFHGSFGRSNHGNPWVFHQEPS